MLAALKAIGTTAIGYVLIGASVGMVLLKIYRTHDLPSDELLMAAFTSLLTGAGMIKAADNADVKELAAAAVSLAPALPTKAASSTPPPAGPANG